MKILLAGIVAVLLNALSTAAQQAQASAGAGYPCLGQGYRNETTGNCMCINGFYGYNCQFRYCPFGKSWNSKPLVAHTRNVERVACSNAGDCNRDTGECECRSGYDGRACERLACPTRPMVRLTAGVTDFYDSQSFSPDGATQFPVSVGIGGEISNMAHVASNIPGSILKASVIPGLDPPCSGHGRCRSMREASTMWDGLSLVSPPVYYSSWEGDMVQGCLCDAGWDSFDCSFRSCPKGRDPLDAAAASYVNEVYTLHCQADAGYFAIDIMGGSTAPIPFDADHVYLKRALEAVDGVGRVDVTIQEELDGIASVCGATVSLRTKFTLRDHAGQLAPARINLKLANSRFQPLSSTALETSGSAPTIYFSSEYSLKCTGTADNHGFAHFTYGDSISAGIDITANGAAAAVDAAVTGLAGLVGGGWEGFDVVTSVIGADSNDKICYGTTENVVFIEIKSDFGNIPGLQVVDGSYRESANYVSLGHGAFEGLDIVLTSNSGSGEVFECSNQGVCDRSTGTCLCRSLENFETNNRHVTFAKAASSDPSTGDSGNIGNCGHMEHYLGGCSLADENSDAACNGQGVCKSGKCMCYDGFSGMDCKVRECPKAAAWFDEPTGPTTAHAPKECAGFGICDRELGTCVCRTGFTGEACQIKDCPLDPSTGEYCSGHGYCKSVHDVFALYGLEYGNHLEDDVARPETWDANRVNECVCAAKFSADEYAHPLMSPQDPKDLAGRYHTGGRPLPGWTGYSCHQRLCPRGDSHMTENSLRGDAVEMEQQRIMCTLTSGSYTLTFFGQTTPSIAFGSDAATIKRTIESINTVGNVTITMEHVSGTACNAAHTAGIGVVVQFDTEGGDLPLTVVTSSTGSGVTIEAEQEGTSENLECGGIGVGTCDRDTGVCECAPDRYSSDGAGGLGANGDCGHRPNRAGFANDFAA